MPTLPANFPSILPGEARSTTATSPDDAASFDNIAVSGGETRDFATVLNTNRPTAKIKDGGAPERIQTKETPPPNAAGTVDDAPVVDSEEVDTAPEEAESVENGANVAALESVVAPLVPPPAFIAVSAPEALIAGGQPAGTDVVLQDGSTAVPASPVATPPGPTVQQAGIAYTQGAALGSPKIGECRAAAVELSTANGTSGPLAVMSAPAAATTPAAALPTVSPSTSASTAKSLAVPTPAVLADFGATVLTAGVGAPAVASVDLKTSLPAVETRTGIYADGSLGEVPTPAISMALSAGASVEQGIPLSDGGAPVMPAEMATVGSMAAVSGVVSMSALGVARPTSSDVGVSMVGPVWGGAVQAMVVEVTPTAIRVVDATSEDAVPVNVAPVRVAPEDAVPVNVAPVDADRSEFSADLTPLVIDSRALSVRARTPVPAGTVATTPQANLAAGLRDGGTPVRDGGMVQSKKGSKEALDEGVVDSLGGVGTFTAKQVTVMPQTLSKSADVSPLVEGTTRAFDVGTGVLPETAVERTEAALATAAVETVGKIVELTEAAAAASKTSVEVSVPFGDEHVRVRIRFAEGQVQTTISSRSADVRDALSKEWQAVQPSLDAARVAFATPVFRVESGSASASSNNASYDSGTGARQQSQQDAQGQSRPSYAGWPSTPVGRSPAGLSSSTPVGTPTTPDTSRRLQVFV